MSVKFLARKQGLISVQGCTTAMTDITRIVSAIEGGEPTAADELLPLVYQEPRNLVTATLAHKKPGKIIHATVVVHEAWLQRT